MSRESAVSHMLAKGFVISPISGWWVVPRGYQPTQEDAENLRELFNYGFGGYEYQESTGETA